MRHIALGQYGRATRCDLVYGGHSPFTTFRRGRSILTITPKPHSPRVRAESCGLPRWAIVRLAEGGSRALATRPAVWLHVAVLSTRLIHSREQAITGAKLQTAPLRRLQGETHCTSMGVARGISSPSPYDHELALHSHHNPHWRAGEQVDTYCTRSRM